MAFFRNRYQIQVIPETRKYKTISSIPKETKEYKIFQDYIEIEKLLFCEDSANKNVESLFKEITSIIERNTEKQKLIIQYLVEILLFYIVIRPKETKFPCILLSNLLLKYPSLHKFIFKNIKMENDKYSHKHSCDHILAILYSQGIYTNEDLNEYQENYITRQEKIHSHYKQGSLYFILIENDIEELKKYIISHNDFSPDVKIMLDDDFGQNQEIIEIISKNQYCDNININLLDFCSFYGSSKCYKFLKMNGFEYDEFISKMSICGGNFEIIHDCEESGISFDYCYKLCIKYHHKTINEWLLSNYKCEVFPSFKCLDFYDYETFLFLQFNKIDINEETTKNTPFQFFCKQLELNFEAIRLLLNKGINVNQGLNTPLQCLCSNSKVNFEAIQLLINNGADVNKGFDSPLQSLCSHKKVNLEAVKFLIDNGAKANNDHGSALASLCSQDKVNLEGIQLLIDHGADVNGLLIPSVARYTPLDLLFRRKELNLEAIQLIIDNGGTFYRHNIRLLYRLEHKDFKTNIPDEIIKQVKNLNNHPLQDILYKDNNNSATLPTLNMFK